MKNKDLLIQEQMEIDDIDFEYEKGHDYPHSEPFMDGCRKCFKTAITKSRQGVNNE